MPGNGTGNKAVYGVGLRDVLYPGEDAYFKANPNVAGMAAEDDHIIINPYSTLKDNEMQAVMMNEAARVLMRKGAVPKPTFALSPKQMEKFKTYSKDMDDIRQTFAARMLSGDPSAIEPTDEQVAFAAQLRKFMGIK